MRLPLAVLVAAAAVLAGQARADDGGSGTYAASGSTYQVALVNSGTTTWQYFTLTAPSGTAFGGGATQGESTAPCVAGQPNGLPNELECGPLTVAPGGRVGVVATVTGTASCGATFHLAVSSTGTAPFTSATDIAPAASCGGTAAPQAGGACSSAAEEAAAAATVAELRQEEQALSFDWSAAAKLLARTPRSAAVNAARVAVARLSALQLAVAGRETTAASTLAAVRSATTCQGSPARSCIPGAAGRAKVNVFDDAVQEIEQTGIAAAAARLPRSRAAMSVRAGAAQLAAFTRKRPALPHC
jgi:hypothetical protein